MSGRSMGLPGWQCWILVRTTRFAVFCVLALALTVSCRKPTDSNTAEPQPTAAGAKPSDPVPPRPMPAELPDVLARVNGEPVQKSDFDRIIRNFELSNGPIPAARRDEIFRTMLDQLITYTAMTQEARTQNVAVSDAEIDARIKQMQGGNSDEHFKKAMHARNMSVEQLRTDARVQLTIEKIMEAHVSGMPAATEADARDFYDKNPDKFNQEMVRASHILLRADQKTPEATRQQLRARMDGLLKRARSGEDFASLAREHSQDGSARQGGDLGYFTKDRMVPPFAEAAFSAPAGQVSDVVTTNFGYHIIKVMDKKSAIPFEQVNGQIQEFLTAQKKQERAGQFVEGVRKRARIEVLV